ncbi:MAG: hypothetical protein ACLRVA_11520 [Bifidobacterium longum]
MNTKTDEGLYEKARKLFISCFASMFVRQVRQCFPQCGLMVFPGVVIVSR